jgi:hypothetical protein
MFSEGRRPDRISAQAIIQVAAKASLSDFVVEILIGRGDEAYVYISRNIVQASDISPLSRYVATPPDAGGKAASPLEKIYSFFVKDLAEASARKRHSRPGNCLLLIRWVTGHKL